MYCIEHFQKYASSVSDLGCLSRILIFPLPGSWISDPGSKNSNERHWGKKFVVIPFFWSHKFHKIELFNF